MDRKFLGSNQVIRHEFKWIVYNIHISLLIVVRSPEVSDVFERLVILFPQ